MQNLRITFSSQIAILIGQFTRHDALEHTVTHCGLVCLLLRLCGFAVLYSVMRFSLHSLFLSSSLSFDFLELDLCIYHARSNFLLTY